MVQITGGKSILKPKNTHPLRPWRLRALVADGNHATLDVVCHMLEALGYRVDSANGGVAAMRFIQSATYDLVVTNLEMADMDGYSLAGWIRHSTRHTKVIVMTARCQSEVVNYMHSGIVDGWLFKPFSLIGLGTVVRKVAAHTPDGFEAAYDRMEADSTPD